MLGHQSKSGDEMCAARFGGETLGQIWAVGRVEQAAEEAETLLMTACEASPASTDDDDDDDDAHGRLAPLRVALPPPCPHARQHTARTPLCTPRTVAFAGEESWWCRRGEVAR